MVTIVSRAAWGARPPKYVTPLNFARVDKFIVHYSGASRAQTVKSIQNYSMDSKGYSDIDYNYIVKDGLIYMGRGDNAGGHTLNNNSTSIGVCVIGQDGDATDADFAAVRDLYDHMCARIGRQLRKMGHRDANPGQTDCPGNEIETWVQAGMPHPGGGDEMEVIRKIQQGLLDAGFDPGGVDGEWGPRTMAAFVAALKAAGPAGPAGPPGPPGPAGSIVGAEITLVGKVTQAS